MLFFFTQCSTIDLQQCRATWWMSYSFWGQPHASPHPHSLVLWNYNFTGGDARKGGYCNECISVNHFHIRKVFLKELWFLPNKKFSTQTLTLIFLYFKPLNIQCILDIYIQYIHPVYTGYIHTIHTSSVYWIYTYNTYTSFLHNAASVDISFNAQSTCANKDPMYKTGHAHWLHIHHALAANL